jgi:hypothetical protein
MWKMFIHWKLKMRLLDGIKNDFNNHFRLHTHTDDEDESLWRKKRNLNVEERKHMTQTHLQARENICKEISQSGDEYGCKRFWFLMTLRLLLFLHCVKLKHDGILLSLMQYMCVWWTRRQMKDGAEWKKVRHAVRLKILPDDASIQMYLSLNISQGIFSFFLLWRRRRKSQFYYFNFILLPSLVATSLKNCILKAIWEEKIFGGISSEIIRFSIATLSCHRTHTLLQENIKVIKEKSSPAFIVEWIFTQKNTDTFLEIFSRLLKRSNYLRYDVNTEESLSMWHSNNIHNISYTNTYAYYRLICVIR